MKFKFNMFGSNNKTHFFNLFQKDYTSILNKFLLKDLKKIETIFN